MKRKKMERKKRLSIKFKTLESLKKTRQLLTSLSFNLEEVMPTLNLKRLRNPMLSRSSSTRRILRRSHPRLLPTSHVSLSKPAQEVEITAPSSQISWSVQ
jgi:hypothetical protein